MERTPSPHVFALLFSAITIRYNLTIVRDIQAPNIAAGPSDAASIIASALSSDSMNERGPSTTQTQVRPTLRLRNQGY